MKNIIVICIGFILVFNCALANTEYRKEEKVLEQTIKSFYEVWFLDSYTQENQTTPLYQKIDLSENLIARQVSYEKKEKKGSSLIKMDTELVSERVTDFSFNISGSQAVVKFNVDQEAKSAFLEKKDDNWELICIASLDIDL